ncbi:MAG: hypothetical protein ACTS4Z_01125 [Candidatus Hodgkinia cicadicola]
MLFGPPPRRRRGIINKTVIIIDNIVDSTGSAKQSERQGELHVHTFVI